MASKIVHVVKRRGRSDQDGNSAAEVANKKSKHCSRHAMVALTLLGTEHMACQFTHSDASRMAEGHLEPESAERSHDLNQRSIAMIFSCEPFLFIFSASCMGVCFLESS